MRFRAKKTFGQHFLKDAGIVSAIVEAMEIEPGETVVEVGPGTGVLTRALVSTGARVIAIEADRDLIPNLRKEFGNSIELIECDALKFDHSLLPTSYFLCSNLPYNVGTEILERFLTSKYPPARSVVMVQKEVGERMLAKPGEMSLLSVAVQIYNDVKDVISVPPTSFEPMPKVDSLVVRLDKNLKCEAPEKVIAIAKPGFSSRRKQLHKNLERELGWASDDVKKWLVSRGLSESARAQELSVEDWINLFLSF